MRTWGTSGLRVIARVALAAFVCVVIAAVAVLVVRYAPARLSDTAGLNPDQRVAERGRVRLALLAFLAGTVTAIGALYTARTFALNRRGQITERFTRAVDQLGHHELNVRIGGIYALERLARDSRDDHGPIMEVLTAYVRQHSRWPPAVAAETTHVVRQPSALRRILSAAGQADRTHSPAEPPPAAVDVQAVISVLSRRKLAHERGASIDFDLAFTNLRGVRADGLNLERARLTRAQLQDAILVGARLQQANLAGANLSRIQLLGAKLECANLDGALLYGANLRGANLAGASLRNVKFNSNTRPPIDHLRRHAERRGGSAA